MSRVPGDAIAFPRLAFPVGAVAPEFKSQIEEFNRNAEALYGQLNGRISLGSLLNAWSGHLDGELLVITVPQANTDFAHPHGLERIPTGFIVVDSTTPDALHRLAATPPHSETLLWFRSAAAAGSRYTIFAF